MDVVMLTGENVKLDVLTKHYLSCSEYSQLSFTDHVGLLVTVFIYMHFRRYFTINWLPWLHDNKSTEFSMALWDDTPTTLTVFGPLSSDVTPSGGLLSRFLRRNRGNYMYILTFLICTNFLHYNQPLGEFCIFP